LSETENVTESDVVETEAKPEAPEPKVKAKRKPRAKSKAKTEAVGQPVPATLRKPAAPQLGKGHVITV